MGDVSVIIPLYNKEPHIEKTILSVLNQTYKYFELIVVNDGSTDNGLEIVKTIKDPRIKVINQKNKGVSAARNRGVTEASNDLISFLDADDEWKPLFLESLIKVINKFPNAGMVGAAYEAVKNNRRHNLEFYEVPGEEGIIENYFKALIKRNPTCSSAVMMHKVVFNYVGGFPIELKRGEDSLLWCKIALNYPVAFINKPLALRNYDAINRLSSNHNILDEFPLFDYIEKNKLKLDQETHYYAKEYVFNKHLLRASQCIRTGNIKLAKKFLLRAKDTKEFRKRYIKLRLLSILPNRIVLMLKTFKG